MQSPTNHADSAYGDDASRWQAVLERDARADGQFVYAVTSTGIFCRPTCPSRRPQPERVVYYDQPSDAIAGGYRACKRCAPEAASADARFVEQVVTAIDDWEDGRPTLDDLAEITGLSPGHLQRKFKAATGVSPADFARQRRMDRLRSELRRGRDVTGSVYEAGFDSSAALYEAAGRELGMTPGAYRNGAQGIEIRYATAQTTLGPVVIAYTDVGVASIQFGDDEDDLVVRLAAEFPQAELVPEPESHPWLQVVLDYLTGEQPHPELPLDIRGTAFQRRVWQAIRVIPPGETRSYGEIAAEIGRPTAARAVANACGQNRLALAIPCHRVVRADGGYGGYRWGAERKSVLLELEAAD